MWFGELALKFLQQEFQRCGACEKEDMKMLEGEVGRFKELICSSIKSLAEISSTNFVAKEVEKNNNSCDLEAGKSNGGNNTCMVSGLGEDGIEQTIGSFLQLSRIVVDNLYGDEGEKEMKSQVVLSLSAVGFSLCACIRGTMEIEEAIKELVQWENPSSEID